MTFEQPLTVLIANIVSEKAAKTVGVAAVDVQKEKKAEAKK